MQIAFYLLTQTKHDIRFEKYYSKRMRDCTSVWERKKEGAAAPALALQEQAIRSDSTCCHDSNAIAASQNSIHGENHHHIHSNVVVMEDPSSRQWVFPVLSASLSNPAEMDKARLPF